MKKTHRLLGIALACAVTVGGTGLSNNNIILDFNPIANVRAMSQGEVNDKLEALMNQYVGTTWNDNYYGIQCKGFANLIFYKLYGVDYIGAYDSEKYYIPSPKGATEVGRLNFSSMSLDRAKELLKKGKPGDLIQVRRRGKSWGHTMILVNSDDNGITIFDCNSDGANGVKKYYQDYSTFYNKNSAMSLYHANGIDDVSPFGPEASGYSLPINTKAINKCNTYDGNGNVESNRWIDAGDDCVIDKIYINGFVHVEYPSGSTRRWAYAKLDNFNLNSPPNLCVDAVTSGEGVVNISGWAYDPDNKDASLSIHVYYDDNIWLGECVANNPDDEGLKNVIGSASSYNHRFASTFEIPSGRHNIKIAALDTVKGETWNYEHDVDVSAPSVNLAGDIEVYSGGVESVSFSGWAFDWNHPDTRQKVVYYLGNEKGANPDLWLADGVAKNDRGDGTFTGFSETLKTKVTGEYYIWVGIVDQVTGRHEDKWIKTPVPVKITKPDTTNPVIQSVTISDKTTAGYKVTIEVTDDKGVTRVAVPTWTGANGQDDLAESWDKTQLAKKVSADTWEFTVKTADHKNEYGVYYTDVYAWDATNNMDKWSAETKKRTTVRLGEFKLTCDANGGELFDGKTTFSPAADKGKLTYQSTNFNNLEELKPTRDNYTFTGWYSEKTGGTMIYGINGKYVNDGKVWKDGKYQKWSDLTVYAQWKPDAVAGDLNADGKLNAMDVVLLNYWMLGKLNDGSVSAKNCDLNGDGKVNIVDYVMLKSKVISVK